MPTEKQSFITNRYQLLEKLGQGGMGAVYPVLERGKALDLETVVKEILEEFSDADNRED